MSDMVIKEPYEILEILRDRLKNDFSYDVQIKFFDGNTLDNITLDSIILCPVQDYVISEGLSPAYKANMKEFEYNVWLILKSAGETTGYKKFMEDRHKILVAIYDTNIIGLGNKVMKQEVRTSFNQEIGSHSLDDLWICNFDVYCTMR